MSASDEIKEYLEMMHEDTNPKDWKRVSKTKTKGVEVREFINKKTNQEVIVLGDGEDFEFFDYEKGDVLTYCIVDVPDENQLFVSFSFQKYWDNNHCIYDREMSGVLEFFGVPKKFTYNEDMENSFTFEPDSEYPTKKDINDVLQPLGFVYNSEMEKLIEDNF